ncbi:SgrR family transcriptional regulator [Vibrio mediterranei]|uniref:SgrR family transcriptional regulator n=1 Tax=Vibrio mediterranei TaxID=689 RepID=UPI0040697A41
MKDQRALQYYERLSVLGIKFDIQTSLGAVAECLCTTPRHGRTLLQELQQRGWISWTPKVGRNQRSVLRLKYSLMELKQILGRALIEDGHYELAMTLLEGDQQRFGALLQQTSGTMVREGQLHIQLTYQRVFDALLPHRPLRNSERFLVRQIYACLTGCEKNGKVIPQLAHHWQANHDATVWRFYLRPQLRFHSNVTMDVYGVAKLFQALRTLPEYQQELSHVEDISANQQSVTFRLSSPDLGFAALLSDLRYSIQPVDQIGQADTLTVDGCGPFQVVEHSNERLRLQANDNYYGMRSLTDTVTIWQLDQAPSERIQLGHAEADATSDEPYYLLENDVHSGDSSQTRIENGCLYLLFNMHDEHNALTPEQRRYLSKLLSPEFILKQDQLSELLMASVPAHNLLPSWTPIRPLCDQVTPLPKKLDIAVYDHLVVLDCANVISTQLNEMGIESQVNIYSLEELHQRSVKREIAEDIIIASFNVDDNVPISVFRWMCSDAILRHGLPYSAKQWLDGGLAEMRQTVEVSGYLNKLESLATTMIYENWLSPLFHHRQTLRWRGVLQGVSITDWSWPDFKHVWVEDELD